MRRIDIIIISFLIFGGGAIAYGGLQLLGIDSTQAGIWTQAILVGGLIIWLLTYLLRVFTHNMTYNQQLKDYETAVFQKRLDEMTPEEIEQLQAEIEQERQQQSK